MKELWSEALKQENGLFHITDNGHVIVSPFAKSDEKTLNTFFQLGRVLGKAFLFGISLDIPFADFVYTKLLMQKHVFSDLQSLDAALYKNLQWLSEYNGIKAVSNGVGNVETLGLTFSLDEPNPDSTINVIGKFIH
jgi:hypothetical protein